MLIEYDESDFKILEEKEINKVKYRIVEYNSGYEGLQYCNEGTLLSEFVEGADEWRTIAIHPYNSKIPLKNGLGFIKNNGEFLLKEILQDKENTFKLKNGEYYEVKIYLDDSEVSDFREIVEKRDYDDMIKRLDAYYYDIYEKQVESINESNRRREKESKFYIALVCMCILLLIYALINSIRGIFV